MPFNVLIAAVFERIAYWIVPAPAVPSAVYSPNCAFVLTAYNTEPLVWSSPFNVATSAITPDVAPLIALVIPLNPMVSAPICKNFESSLVSLTNLKEAVEASNSIPSPAVYSWTKLLAGILIVFGVVVSKPLAFFSVIANVRTNADVAASYAAPERNWSLGILITDPNVLVPSAFVKR